MTRGGETTWGRRSDVGAEECDGGGGVNPVSPGPSNRAEEVPFSNAAEEVRFRR